MTFISSLTVFMFSVLDDIFSSQETIFYGSHPCVYFASSHSPAHPSWSYIGVWESTLHPDLELPTCPNRALSYHRYLPNLLFPGAPGLTSFGFPSSLCLVQSLTLTGSPADPQHWNTLGFYKGIPIPVFFSSCGLISLSQQLCGIAALIPIS